MKLTAENLATAQRRRTPAFAAISGWRLPAVGLLALLSALVLRFAMGSRTASTTVPAAPALLRAGDNVALPAPPLLPADDAGKTFARLEPLAPLREAFFSHMRDRPFLERFGAQAAVAQDVASAYAAYRALVALDPREPTFENRLAQAETRLGLYARSAARFRELVARFPENVNGHISLSQAVYGLGYRDQTISSLEAGSRALRPNDPMGHLFIAKEYEKLINYPQAVAESKTAWMAMPGDPVAAIVYARMLYRLRKVTEAETILERVVAQHPDNVPARSTLAQVLENPLNPHRDLQAAENHYLEALRLNRGDTDDSKSLGLLYMEEGRYKQAAFIFTLLLQSAPDDAAGRLQLGKAYARLGMAREAAEQSRIAAQLIDRDNREDELGARKTHRSMSAEDRLNMARHYMDHGQFSKALPEIQAGYAMNPSSDRAARMLTEFDAKVGTRLAGFTAKVLH